jgi:hypothetical protein
MVQGLMADWAAGEHHDTIEDDGYDMWFDGLREIRTRRPMKLVSTEPQEDFTTLTTASGKTYTGLSFDQIQQWELDQTGFPDGTSVDEQHALRVAAGARCSSTGSRSRRR